ncbi:tetratricopeptide repeat protein 16 isoform X3 [Sciurus carolinensis]|uniref:tetratricopeptide repeat protein 16 isoform X3 n=1 Tax=Sciurus carolinensis TaxID=30640 RepID=UPI001FB2C506|nr:tetratricopeptide repeat protein 16 isoform X3 [Sciurus carolinensis]
MEDSGEVPALGKAKAKAEDRDALALDQVPSETIPKPRVIPVPKGTLKRIFGTSQVFLNLEDIKPRVIKLTLPLKVKEYYQRAHLCLEQEDWEMAVLFFSRALQLDPQLVDSYAWRAEAFIQLCDFSSAAQNLRRAYSFQPENPKYLERLAFVLYIQGQCLYEQCNYRDALNVFSQGSVLQPNKACFRYRSMACLLALKQYQDCLSLITKEVKQGTANPDIYILRARLYNFFQKPRLCFRDLRSALLLDPEHLQAKMLLQTMVDQAQQARQDAGILAVQGLLQHALQRINCAIENNPLDPSLFLFRGTLYRRLREFDSAVEDLLKALDMLTDRQGNLVQQAQRQLLLAYNDFAVHCYEQGAYQEGVLLLNKVLREERREKGLYINRGDCFFQLGNLAFAEADYREALALSPQDEGANMRMGMLQEKMGFCEEKRRQFQKAEVHFSAAIQHNPYRAQYYVYRAKSRQFLQDIFGARQDVATVLLLNPKQPKLLPLLTSLFPGMSVEEVLRSQVAHLARLQLMQMKRGSAASNLQGVVGILRERELERAKAKALLLSWKQEQPESSRELEPTAQGLQVEPEEARPAEEDDTAKKKEDIQELALHKLPSLSEEYLDQTSSGSVFRFRVESTSESTTSTTCREYRSSSTTAATPSDSSLLKTSPSSDSGNSKGDLSLSPGRRKTPASQERRQSSSKPEATQDQSQSSRKTEDTQGPKQRPQTKATRSPRQRLRRAKAAWGKSWRPGRADVPQGQSWGLIRNSSKVQGSQDSCCSFSKITVTQDQSQMPSRTEAALGSPQSMGSRPSQTDVTTALSPSPSRTKTPPSPSQRLSEMGAPENPAIMLLFEEAQ